MDITFSKAKFQKASQNLKKPLIFKFYLWKKLPMAAISGMKIKHIDENSCTVSIQHKWLNQNPFKSTFWAVLGMTAEMSTGALLLSHSQSYSLPFRFILVGTKARFYKKAKGLTSCTCEGGEKIKSILNNINQTDFEEEIELHSSVKDDKGILLAEFSFFWQIRSNG